MVSYMAHQVCGDLKTSITLSPLFKLKKNAQVANWSHHEMRKLLLLWDEMV